MSKDITLGFRVSTHHTGDQCLMYALWRDTDIQSLTPSSTVPLQFGVCPLYYVMLTDGRVRHSVLSHCLLLLFFSLFWSACFLPVRTRCAVCYCAVRSVLPQLQQEEPSTWGLS